MLTHIRPSLVLLAAFTLLTGFAYPLVITGVAQAISPGTAEGSLITRDGTVVGSALIAQDFKGAGYLQPRPSAGDFATLPSAASNYAPTNAALVKAVAARAAAYQKANGVAPPIDAVTTSGSGLDPDISPENAFDQAARIAKARGVETSAVQAILAKQVRGPWLGLYGLSRVNVLKANLALDAALPKASSATN